jgi:hypothetical protein
MQIITVRPENISFATHVTLPSAAHLEFQITLMIQVSCNMSVYRTELLGTLWVRGWTADRRHVLHKDLTCWTQTGSSWCYPTSLYSEEIGGKDIVFGSEISKATSVEMRPQELIVSLKTSRGSPLEGFLENIPPLWCTCLHILRWNIGKPRKRIQFGLLNSESVAMCFCITVYLNLRYKGLEWGEGANRPQVRDKCWAAFRKHFFRSCCYHWTRRLIRVNKYVPYWNVNWVSSRHWISRNYPTFKFF